MTKPRTTLRGHWDYVGAFRPPEMTLQKSATGEDGERLRHRVVRPHSTAAFSSTQFRRFGMEGLERFIPGGPR